MTEKAHAVHFDTSDPALVMVSILATIPDIEIAERPRRSCGSVTQGVATLPVTFPRRR